MARQGEQIPLTAPDVRRLGLVMAAVLAAVLILTGLIVADDWSRTGARVTSPEREGVTGQPTDGLVIEQGYAVPFAYLSGLTFDLAPVGGGLDGGMTVEVLSASGEALASVDVSLNSLSGNTFSLSFEMPLPVQGEMTLRLTFADPEGSGRLPALYMGSHENAGRVSVTADQLDHLTVQGTPVSGRLCARLDGYSPCGVMRWYWPIAALLTLLTALWGYGAAYLLERGRRTRLLWIIEAMRHYDFLIRQLVSRDFNTKYRQSLLGVVWSFLNPLLTMTVQYIVFSTLFSTSIDNFPVYLLTGIVLFNFFSEACTLGLESIVSNGSLINKVYMPKYIYPFSRTLSSLINMLITLIPLLMLMLFTGTPITWSLLLMPIDLLLLFGFTLGLTLLLCTLNVFFRDTRFLWSVLVLLWTYLTPLFYPESIIPFGLRTVYRMNPMYQFITFLRAIAMEGTAPTPANLLGCLIASAGMLLLGSWVFHRHQDHFVFHL